MKKLLLLLCLCLPLQGYAYGWHDWWHNDDQRAAQLLRAGKPHQAAELFRDHNWKGTAYFRGGVYNKAAEQFAHGETADALYNVGNALAYQRQFKEAIKAYDKALAKDPKHEDAKFNRSLLAGFLKKQKKQQQKQNQQDKQQNKDKNKDKQNKPSKSKQNDKKQQDKAHQDPAKQNRKDKTDIRDLAKQAASAQKRRERLLRGVDDDPGGLLKRKFMRDYMNRQSKRYGEA